MSPECADEPEGTPAPELLERTAQWLAVLAHPVRLAVLCALDASGPLTAGALQEQLGIEASALSHHLRPMRRARLVRVRPEGRHRIYALDDHHVAHIVRDAMRHVSEDDRPVG
ncbi:MAG: metalloregulator ArsR/SmtB family transcription factor [Myxococcales bacterium]|nr:metalloregulator ArsR/SmtB family transcription factor [Myxococcales bacterium]